MIGLAGDELFSHLQVLKAVIVICLVQVGQEYCDQRRMSFHIDETSKN